MDVNAWVVRLLSEGWQADKTPVGRNVGQDRFNGLYRFSTDMPHGTPIPRLSREQVLARCYDETGVDYSDQPYTLFDKIMQA